jgi:hypothetical protein
MTKANLEYFYESLCINCLLDHGKHRKDLTVSTSTKKNQKPVVVPKPVKVVATETKNSDDAIISFHFHFDHLKSDGQNNISHSGVKNRSDLCRRQKRSRRLSAHQIGAEKKNDSEFK